MSYSYYYFIIFSDLFIKSMVSGMKRRKLRKSIFTKKNLSIISKENIKPVTTTGIDQMTYDTYMKNNGKIIDSIITKISTGKYKVTRYREKLILKNRKSPPRLLSIPTFKDRVMIKGVHQVLSEYYPRENRASLPQETIKKVFNLIISEKYDYYIKYDIENFFGTIDHKLLMDFLKIEIKDNFLLSLIENIISTATYPEEINDIGIPQGISISNILAQIYMTSFDSFFNEMDIGYVRYVDDILIFCNENEYENIDNLFKEKINFLKLCPHEVKKDHGLFKSDSSFDFLGYRILLENRKHFSITKSAKQRLENRIISKITEYKANPKINKKRLIFELNLMITGTKSRVIDGEFSKMKRYGWIFYYSQITDYTILFELDAFVKKQLIKVLNKTDLEKVKKFVKSFYEMKYNFEKSNYFFCPELLSVEEKKNILNNCYNYRSINLDNLTEKKIDEIFRKEIHRKIKRNERDIIHGTS